MGEVYAGSYITIAATLAPNDDYGFLRPREERYTGYIVDKISGVTIREAVEHLTPRTTDALLRRAWAFQERVLPSRVLSYGTQEMKWHCKSFEKCECGFDWPEIKDASTGTSEAQQERHYHELIGNMGNPKRRPTAAKELLDYWRNFVVPEYTKLQLTKESDRLPALSAIASEILRTTQDTYLAGLWLRDLPQALAWISKPSSASSHLSIWSGPNLGKLPAEYRAPTWSWASVKGGVEYLRMRPQTSPIEILGAFCTPVSASPTGEVKAGRIRISGNVLAATLEINEVAQNRCGRLNIALRRRNRCEHRAVRLKANRSDDLWEVSSGAYDIMSKIQRFTPDVPLEQSGPSVCAACTSKLSHRTLKRSHVVRTYRSPEPLLRLQGEVELLYIGEQKEDGEYSVLIVLVRSMTVHGAYERIGVLLVHMIALRAHLGVFERIIFDIV